MAADVGLPEGLLIVPGKLAASPTQGVAEFCGARGALPAPPDHESFLGKVVDLLEPFWCTAIALIARAIEAGERLAMAALDLTWPLLMAEVAGRSGWIWLAFIAVVTVLLAFDLGVMNRRTRELSVVESYLLSAFYVAVALAFGGWIWWVIGRDGAIAFLTAYLVEKSLAIDNVFVMVAIFSALAIPRHLQQPVLFWGILGVIVLRVALIGLGTALVGRYAWMLDLFAVCLILTGAAMVLSAGRRGVHARQRLLDGLGRRLRMTRELHGERFFVTAADRATGRVTRCCTPLFLALLLILAVDLVFAVDSVPAVFAITQDPFIVYTANMLAIVGLRALYFKIAVVMGRSRYMIYALAAILVLIGGEVLLANVIGKVPPAWSLAATLTLLAGGILFSLWRTRRERWNHSLQKPEPTGDVPLDG